MPRLKLRRLVRLVGVAGFAGALSSCVSSERVVAPQHGVAPQSDESTASVSGGGVVISQLYGGGGNSGAKYKNDFIELYNPGTATVHLTGWSVQYASATGTSWQVTPLADSIQAGHYYLVQEAVGAAGTDTLPTPDAKGVIPMSATAGKVALVNSTAALTTTGCPRPASVVDFVGYGSTANCYEGSGATPTLSNTSAALRAGNGATDTDDNKADFATGAPNPRSSGTGGGGSGGPPPTGHVTVSGRSTDLPVGFQTQLFLNAGSTDGAGAPVGNGDVVWSTSSASVVDVNPSTGVITARTAGSARITATAKSDGSAGSTTIFTSVAPLSTTARVGHNVELGTPTDADPSDDVIIVRRQYTLSYNPSRGTPNWVSWNLDPSHEGARPRCNCFTADTALTRLGYPAYDTNDWINGGVWSRGHMSPSADWNVTDGDNAPTFFLSNMVPQNQTLNSGAWGDLENHLRDVSTGTTEIYIVSGPIYTRNRGGAGIDGFGFMNSTGRIAVPDSIWKVAVIVPDGRSADQITSPSDVQVIAANFPNDASGTGTWDRYATTIDAIQRSTGYNLLSALPEAIQCRLEARDCLPQPTIVPTSGTASATAGATFVVNTTATDEDGADGPWRYVLEWGDGTSFTATLSTLPTSTRPLARAKVYAAPGTYTIRLSITDRNGGRGVQTLTVTVNP
jgi:DNA/RNA endonuclease G (NUC1)